MQSKIMGTVAAVLVAAVVLLAGCGAPTPTESALPSSSVGEDAAGGQTVPSDADNASAPEGESGVTLDEDDQAVVGTWVMTENTVAGQPLDISDVQTVYLFNDDGTFEMLLDGDSAGQGSFSVEGTKVTFDIGGGDNEMRLEGDRLVAETETADGLSVAVFTRAQN